MIFPAFLRGPWVPDLWISIAAGFPILRPKNCLVFSNFNPSQNHSWGNHSRHGIPGRGKHFKALKPQTETVPEFLSCVSTSPFRSSQIQWTNQKKWLTPKNYIQWYTMIYPLIRKSGWWNFPVGFAEALWFSLGWSSQWCLGIEIDGPVWLLHFSDYHWVIGPFRWRKKHTYIYIYLGPIPPSIFWGVPEWKQGYSSMTSSCPAWLLTFSRNASPFGGIHHFLSINKPRHRILQGYARFFGGSCSKPPKK